MPAFRPLLTTGVLLGSIITSACGAAGTPTTPTMTAAVTTATAPLMVRVDSVCAGRESDIRVFVDAVEIGVTNPGEPGVLREVTVGDHRLSAISRRGTEWGPFPTTVTAAGRVETLGCMRDAL